MALIALGLSIIFGLLDIINVAHGDFFMVGTVLGLTIAGTTGFWIALVLVPLLGLMASISLNLGLLNLLPIPVLDGGHILILLLEGLTRRDFSVRVKERMLLAGFVLLMLLMVTVIYNDLTRIHWVENLMFWR